MADSGPVSGVRQGRSVLDVADVLRVRALFANLNLSHVAVVDAGEQLDDGVTAQLAGLEALGLGGGDGGELGVDDQLGQRGGFVRETDAGPLADGGGHFRSPPDPCQCSPDKD